MEGGGMWGGGRRKGEEESDWPVVHWGGKRSTSACQGQLLHGWKDTWMNLLPRRRSASILRFLLVRSRQPNEEELRNFIFKLCHNSKTQSFLDLIILNIIPPGVTFYVFRNVCSSLDARSSFDLNVNRNISIFMEGVSKVSGIRAHHLLLLPEKHAHLNAKTPALLSASAPPSAHF